jgi:hypothetical protein
MLSPGTGLFAATTARLAGPGTESMPQTLTCSPLLAVTATGGSTRAFGWPGAPLPGASSFPA